MGLKYVLQKCMPLTAFQLLFSEVLGPAIQFLDKKFGLN